MSELQRIDLHDVGVYWKARGLVDERHLPYYVRWLQRFLAGSGGDPRLTWEDAQRAFVEKLERESVPEWQIGQAARYSASTWAAKRISRCWPSYTTVSIGCQRSLRR